MIDAQWSYGSDGRLHGILRSSQLIYRAVIWRQGPKWQGKVTKPDGDSVTFTRDERVEAMAAASDLVQPPNKAKIGMKASTAQRSSYWAICPYCGSRLEGNRKAPATTTQLTFTRRCPSCKKIARLTVAGISQWQSPVLAEKSGPWARHD